MKKHIVHKVDGTISREEILCTTYQMRNFYRQFGDGFFSVLDSMNYIQHHKIVDWCTAGSRILDVCCGRGLMLPLLRYKAKDIKSYTGVDIEPKNTKFLTQRVTDNKAIKQDYYPFDVSVYHGNVANMTELLPCKYDVIIYTSAVEHMHKDDGKQSLYECRSVASDNAVMILTCPNTPADQDGYDTQYKAHVYEWKEAELEEVLGEAGWKIIDRWGLLHSKKELLIELDTLGIGNVFRRLNQYIPNEWLIPVFSPLFPASSKEIGFVCHVSN